MPSLKSQNPISKDILQLCRELQAIPVLDSFYLGGGTALALYFHHRESDDIDLFSSKTYNKAQISGICEEIKIYFKDRIRGSILLNDIDKDKGTPLPDNQIFIRFYVCAAGSSTPIKVELLQNVYGNDLPPTEKDNVKVLPLELIAILKMAAANNRGAKKDIYDMYFLTKDNSAALYEICQDYDTYKGFILNNMEKASIFDQNINEIPLLVDPSPLLTFELNKKKKLVSDKLPMHSNNEIRPIKGNDNFSTAASRYRTKIFALYYLLGITPPKFDIDI